MGHRRGLGRAVWVTALFGALLVGQSGCALLNGFLDPTKIGQFPGQYKERGIVRRLTPRDAPPGPSNAAEPTPEDLVAVYEDYRLAPGDILLLIIGDLISAGVPDQSQVEISATGMIRIPQLGTVKATGLTEQELEDELKARLREAGLLPDADVRAYAQGKRQRVFTVRGSVGRAGVYPITDPDLRLLDVIGAVSDIGANVQKLYIIRRTTPPKGPGEPAPREGEAGKEGLVIPPPTETEPEHFRADLLALGGSRAQPPTTTREEPKLEKADLEAVLAPGQATRPGVVAPQEPTLPPLIFDPQTGAIIEREPGAAASEPAAPTPPQAMARPVPSEKEKPFDWEEVPELELGQRVIEVDVRSLLDGDPRYNIVIRDRDVINVPVDTSVYYLMGEVNRPGAYSFGGRDITLKQAVASSGGLSPLAWPQRCEIIRHEPGTDKQVTIPVNVDAIFAGLEDDVYLRDDDIVNVGSHFVTPFLFVIRNSFRFTYGFGFVYDRNFGDQDAIEGRINPETLRLQQRQARGLPF